MTIEESIGDLIRDLGIDTMSKETQEKVLPQLFTTLQSRIGVRLAQTLTEEQMKKIEELSKKDDEKAANEELRKYVPNYDGLVAEEIQAMKEEMKGLLGK